MKTRRKPKRKVSPESNGFKGIMFIVFIFSLAIFVIFQIISAIQTSSLAAQLSHLEEEKAKLERINKDYSYEVLRASSLSKLEKRSGELGFVKPQDTLFLQLEETVAQAK